MKIQPINDQYGDCWQIIDDGGGCWAAYDFMSSDDFVLEGDL